MLITELPTSFAVTSPLNLPHFELHPGRDVEVGQPGSMHVGRTIYAYNIKDRNKYGEWIYFHALISRSNELVDFFFNHGKYDLKGDLSDSQKRSLARDGYISEPDLLNYIFQCNVGIQKTYEELYECFLRQDPIVIDALRNYYFANSLSGNTSKHMDVSYWRIVIYMGVIETLMGEQPQCRNENKCRVCGRNVGIHSLISNREWLEQELFSKIKNIENRTQYRRIVDECKYAIRNNSVHRGLLPSAEHIHLEDGSYYYDTEKTLGGYLKDTNALRSLVKHMEELTRFYALNKIFGLEIYPELLGEHVSYLTLRAKR